MAITKVSRDLLNTSIVDNGNATAITIDSSENVGIGVSPSYKLHLRGSQNSDVLYIDDGSQDGHRQLEFSSSSNGQIWTVNSQGDSGGVLGILAFATKGTERLRIDSSGQVKIHTPITNDFFGLSLQYNSGDTADFKVNQATGQIKIGGSATGYYPSFWSNNTERMRITSAGFLHVNSATADLYHRFNNATSGEWATFFYNTSANPYGIGIAFTAAAPNNATNKFLQMSDSAGGRALFYSNGGLHNYQSNDSNLSDEREKKNIEDLSSTWDCVKSWNLRKFHYNEDENSDDKRLGVIAQEVEAECPEVITEWQKQEQKDEVLWTEEDELPEGVSVGDVKTAAQEEIMRKGVKEQQMYWMAIKALQEAMAEIEDLKSRIETLENA